MTMSRRKFLKGLVGLGVVAVAGEQLSRVAVARERWYLFGTLVDVTLGDLRPDQARSALTSLSAALQQANQDWHPWKPGMMGDINRAIAQGREMVVDPQMARMIHRSSQIHRDSGGRFNPAIGRLIATWGFHDDDLRRGGLPAPEGVRALTAAAPTPTDLRIEDGKLISDNPSVQLDFGGYAKGYAIDLGRQLLARSGVRHALINAGGDLVTLGDAPDGRPWRIAIRHPQRTADSIAWLEAGDGDAVFTSGNYERYREFNGHRYPHIIDPTDGMPVRGVASATVIHQDAAFADAAATALVVAGPKAWREVAERLNLRDALVVDEHGRVEMTPDMRQRV